MSSNSQSQLKLSERECELLAATWQCFEGGPPKVNFVKLASITGYTEGSARYALGQVKTKLKKHSIGNGNGNGAGTTTPKGTPKKSAAPKTPSQSGGKRGASKRALDDVDDTPSKKKQKCVEQVRAASEVSIGHDQDEEVKVKCDVDDNDNSDDGVMI